ncbi:hypothetical protein HORIV_62210 [Vreelandella olivaria]|uniref:Uncharacterized protein n=1 Tax=Vreelandella olivaria TaxID=390919 RepID=A0ABN5X3V3_9GAMM|nr:hypothetical protein HORIV_62210 [Halomonas olivaria]
MSEQTKTVLMFVNGQAMSGGSINFALQEAKFWALPRPLLSIAFTQCEMSFPAYGL